jgi:Fur family ferric uptake transcriptional regulator
VTGEVEFPKALKKTSARMLIFKILCEQTTPLSATEIYDKVSIEPHKVNFSTIYRTLRAFEKAGILVSLNLSSSDETVYEIKREQHKHYAICLKCKKRIPIITCPVVPDVEELKHIHFKVTDHNVELLGYCMTCQALYNL